MTLHSVGKSAHVEGMSCALWSKTAAEMSFESHETFDMSCLSYF